MNNYEHTFIAKTDLTQDAFTKLLDKYSKKIEDNGGEIVKTEKWGIINFSSKIKQYKKGKYIHIKFKGSGQTIDNLEKSERMDNAILRFLTVKVKKFDLESLYFSEQKKEVNEKKN